ncbi:MAG: hypothetical protein AAFX06_21355 [Planctomycetota bacterium]
MSVQNFKPAHECQIPSPVAAPASGQIIVDSVLGSCIVQGLKLSDVIVGTEITVRHSKGPSVVIDAPSSLVLAKNADVRIDAAGTSVVASGGTVIGKALFEKTAGQTKVYVLLT